jgi:hypothetical protein
VFLCILDVVKLLIIRKTKHPDAPQIGDSSISWRRPSCPSRVVWGEFDCAVALFVVGRARASACLSLSCPRSHRYAIALPYAMWVHKFVIGIAEPVSSAPQANDFNFGFFWCSAGLHVSNGSKDHNGAAFGHRCLCACGSCLLARSRSIGLSILAKGLGDRSNGILAYAQQMSSMPGFKHVKFLLPNAYVISSCHRPIILRSNLDSPLMAITSSGGMVMPSW